LYKNSSYSVRDAFIRVKRKNCRDGTSTKISPAADGDLVHLLARAVDAALMLQELIASLIDRLDRQSTDPDTEDGGDDEASLGATNPTFPSLLSKPADWSLSQNLTQTRWSLGGNEDREQEHDGRELDTPTDGSDFNGG
jgi:hypothetical protein